MAADGVYARFAVVQTMPLVVLDIATKDDPDPALLQATLFRRLVDRGLAVLPRFFGIELPKGARVGFTLGDDELRLEDDDGDGLLRVPRASLAPGWIDGALRLHGTMLCAGRDLDMDPDLDSGPLCALLDDAAGQDRIAGAIVGVAEPTQGLPLFN